MAWQKIKQSQNVTWMKFKPLIITNISDDIIEYDIDYKLKQ